MGAQPMHDPSWSKQHVCLPVEQCIPAALVSAYHTIPSPSNPSQSHTHGLSVKRILWL
jgi:hypothetical protein